MTRLALTPEQLAILAARRSSTENLMLIARAGAAKTTTLVLLTEDMAGEALSSAGWFTNGTNWYTDIEKPGVSLAEAYLEAKLPRDQIICLAFNTAIAKEMCERLPPNCESRTMHSLGLSAWGKFLGRRTTTSKDKLYRLLVEAIDRLDPSERQTSQETFAETLGYLREGKSAGWVPQSFPGHWRPLCTDAEFFSSLDTDITPLQEELLTTVSEKSWRLTLAGEIDFDDMVLAPAICSVSFPFYPLVLIDEAQDLSPLNHAILRKLARKARLIAVGDPCQAIYGFRGALETSMDLLAERFNCRKLYLTTTFRCAQAIVDEALWRAPDMQAAAWAREGLVLHPTSWSFDLIPDDAAVLCRNNAPLYSLALKMLKAGRYPELSGRDFTKGLLATLRKLGKAGLDQPNVLARIDAWEAKELERTKPKAQASVRDKASCLRVFAEMGATLGDAILFAETVLHREGRVKLMTGHKAKGLEFDSVFILNRGLIKMKGQDPNILYVMQTRAREQLTYIDSSALEEA